MTVMDRCDQTTKRVEQLAAIIQEDVNKIQKFGTNIDGIEKLTLSTSDSLNLFKMQITDANNECRKLIIEESKKVDHDLIAHKGEHHMLVQLVGTHGNRLNDVEGKLDKFRKVQEEILKDMESMDKRKIDNSDWEKFLEIYQIKVMEFEDALAKHDNEIKSVENYVEKYVPCNTQNLIIENLK